MKKLSMLLVVLILACAFMTVPVAAQTQTASPFAGNYAAVSESAISLLYDDFVSKNNNRTVGTDGEKAAANYLADQFYSFGLQNYFGLSSVNFESAESSVEKEKYKQEIVIEQSSTSTIYTHNIVGYIPSANENADTVIIGAHYDNVYASKVVQGGDITYSHGAYDNGSGIAVMLSIAQALTTTGASFDFNVVFVAFAAEETGLNGSAKFIERMKRDKQEHFDNMLIMFNLDVVGAGDYLYLYTDEVTTEHENYLQDVAASENLTIKRPPLDKKLLLLGGYYESVSYTHTAMMSDHANFRNAGKNIAFFFSMNWETYNKVGTVESEKHPAIMHTKDDTLDKVKEYYGDTYLTYMSTAANTITKALAQDMFAATMKSSQDYRVNYGFWTNALWGSLILLGIMLLAAGGVVLLYYRLKKTAPPLKEQPRPTIYVTQVRPQTPPSADDVFGYGGGSGENQRDASSWQSSVEPIEPDDPFDNLGK